MCVFFGWFSPEKRAREGNAKTFEANRKKKPPQMMMMDVPKGERRKLSLCEKTSKDSKSHPPRSSETSSANPVEKTCESSATTIKSKVIWRTQIRKFYGLDFKFVVAPLSMLKISSLAISAAPTLCLAFPFPPKLCFSLCICVAPATEHIDPERFSDDRKYFETAWTWKFSPSAFYVVPFYVAASTHPLPDSSSGRAFSMLRTFGW